MISGITRTIKIPQYTQDELDKRLKYWKQSNALIQDVFPELNESQREFILTGMTDDEWEKEFGSGEEDKVSAFFNSNRRG